MFNISDSFKNGAKNWEKFFCFGDNCIWIGIAKLSLLRTGYFSYFSRFCLSIREAFSNSTDLAVIKEYDKGAVTQISTFLWPVYHIACRKLLWDETFRHLSD